MIYIMLRISEESRPLVEIWKKIKAERCISSRSETIDKEPT